MAFFEQAITVLQTLVIALGAGLGIWGVINLLEGYGNDNPGEVCHTPKELLDLLADDYRTYLEIELTKGKREVTEDDEREADALCKQYLERWKEEQK